MKAMILAAGRGDRMRPLTNTTPKPLLKVNGKPLIQYSIEKLVNAGFKEIVINVAYLASQIIETLGDGHQFGAKIVYSDEGEQGLETAGGIINALPLLGQKPFIVINSDIACEFPLEKLRSQPLTLAHLILVDNPEFNLKGDFSLATSGHLSTANYNRHTFTGIGLYHPKLFENYPINKLKLGPILKTAADAGEVSGEKFKGLWMDIGTPQRLEALGDYYNFKTIKENRRVTSDTDS
jgi:MurNAc alpha-1-phosphate uridylyltransferase